MAKKCFFIAEDLLRHRIGDKPIFVTQVSQIMKDDKNNTFSNINETSQKAIYVVVIATTHEYMHVPSTCRLPYTGMHFCLHVRVECRLRE